MISTDRPASPADDVDVDDEDEFPLFPLKSVLSGAELRRPDCLLSDVGDCLCWPRASCEAVRAHRAIKNKFLRAEVDCILVLLLFSCVPSIIDSSLLVGTTNRRHHLGLMNLKMRPSVTGVMRAICCDLSTGRATDKQMIFTARSNLHRLADCPPFLTQLLVLSCWWPFASGCFPVARLG